MSTDVAVSPVVTRPLSHRAWPKLRVPLAWLIALSVVGGAATYAAKQYAATHRANPVRYETATVDRGPLAAKVTATGSLSALVTVQVGSQVSGRIEALFADYASTVKKGQTVATIEPSLFRASVAQARANDVSAEASVERARAQLVQAERVHGRAKALYAETVASRAELDAAEADLDVARANLTAANAAVAQARAALDQAELNLRYTTILSPIDGTVISRSVDVGQTVAAALQAPTLFTIAQDLTKMQVDTNVAEADVGKIRAGMDVVFTVDAYPQRPFHGTVRQVRDNALTIQNVVTYDAVIDVDNRDRLLKPGMTASVTFVHATRESALRLPNAALRFKPDDATVRAMTAAVPPPLALAPDERGVWALRGGRAALVTVHVGIGDGAATEITAGDLHEGDTVIVEAAAASRGGT